LPSVTKDEREALVLDTLSQSILAAGVVKFVLPFRFLKPDTARTSHYLIFLTKNFRGYHIMKEVMAKAAGAEKSGAPSFTYIPASPQLDFLGGFNEGLDQLEASLLSEFAGCSLAVRRIYETHSVGRPFILANYKHVLRGMVEAGKVAARTTDGKPVAPSLPDSSIIDFPAKET
jgi:hypothetical protein